MQTSSSPTRESESLTGGNIDTTGRDDARAGRVLDRALVIGLALAAIVGHLAVRLSLGRGVEAGDGALGNTVREVLLLGDRDAGEAQQDESGGRLHDDGFEILGGGDGVLAKSLGGEGADTRTGLEELGKVGCG